MPLLSSWLFLAQSTLPGVPTAWVPAVKWLFVFGEPGVSVPGITGGLITWFKVVSLFALLAWSVSWAITAYKGGEKTRGDWLDIASLLALLGCLGSIVLYVLHANGRIKPLTVSGYALEGLIASACALVILVWFERALWTSIAKVGTRSDTLVGVGIHLAIVLGVVVAAYVLGANSAAPGSNVPGQVPFLVSFTSGLRLGATYMGFVVMAKLLWLLIPEVLSIRPRRLFAIAQLAIIESTRKMWAPWVVIVIFAVILAFTHWFLPASTARPAELGRIYVGTLSLLCMLLLTIMVTVLAPLSLPQDIQAQTIYTVVTKPVRRLEMIWGRMLGYMALVTALVLVFGLASLGYFAREVGGKIKEVEELARVARKTDPDRARFYDDQAEQLRSRMSARVPVRGSLAFVDSRGTPSAVGIDVGQELVYRSHIEGGTPSAAIWKFGGRLPDPYDPKQSISRMIPVSSLLREGTIEFVEDRAINLEYGIAAIEARQKSGTLSAAEGARSLAEMTNVKDEVKKLRDLSAKLVKDYNDKVAAAKIAKGEEAATLRRDAAALHSPPIPMEMTFTIYRTTKGRVGDPVYAEIEVENPRTNLPRFRDTFPIREYYTNKRNLPSSYLVGSLGSLNVTVHCMSPTQYLGMAESDFYLLAESGNFGQNYMKGLFGIWLQAMVLTSIGVFAGTFLSWPVALLFTVAFFVAGHAATDLLKGFFAQSMLGGGSFEALIRMINHENQVSDLAPTLGVIVAKSFDAIVMPVMTRMAYLIPNLGSLDVTNTVAEGYAVGWPVMVGNTLVAIAYALPFSIAGYFILKNREVAA